MSRFLEGYTPHSSGTSVRSAINAGLSSLRTGLNVLSSTAAAQRATANAIAASVPGTNSGVLGSARNPVNTTASKVSSLPDAISTTSSSGSVGGGVGGGGVVSTSKGFTKDDSGKVGFADPNFQSAMDMINQISQANNEWSAQQAQKQMDFQMEMSNTAHQREVADLKAAGLNPVLSAGGSGASTPNGAMSQTDESNTRLIAELAYSAIDALGMSAAAYAGGAGGSSKKTSSYGDSWFGRLSDAYASNKLVKRLVDSGLGAAQYAIGGLAVSAGRNIFK